MSSFYQHLLTPEQLAAMERQRAEAEMSNHDWTRLLADELPESTLLSVGRVFGLIARSKDAGLILAAQWEGVIYGILHHKYGLCVACGKNHDRDMADGMAAEAAKHAEGAPTNIVPIVAPRNTFDDMGNYHDHDLDAWKGEWHPSVGDPDDTDSAS